MNMSFATIIAGILIGQSIYSGFVLLLAKSNRQANKYLSFLLFLSSLWLMDSFLRAGGVYKDHPDLYFLPIFYSLGFGPLLFFYTKSITQRNFTFQGKDFYHFLPLVLQGIFYCCLSISSYSFKRWFWIEVHRPYTYDLEFILTLISLFLYAYMCINMIGQYNRWIREQYSEISKIHLNWVKYVYILIISLCCFWLIETILREYFIIYAQLPISAITLGIGILILGTAGLLQADVLSYGMEVNADIYKEEGIVAIDDQIVTLIQNEMLNNQYYLDPELTLRSFSKQIDLPSRQVSNSINSGLGSSYIDFVNSYRVSLVKERLKDETYSHLTLYGIALECGFNSKSTFNRVFKNITGHTPSEFRKNE